LFGYGSAKAADDPSDFFGCGEELLGCPILDVADVGSDVDLRAQLGARAFCYR
jgi:hypothetical protein